MVPNLERMKQCSIMPSMTDDKIELQLAQENQDKAFSKQIHDVTIGTELKAEFFS